MRAILPQRLPAACDRLQFLNLASKYKRAYANICEGHVSSQVVKDKRFGFCDGLKFSSDGSWFAVLADKKEGDRRVLVHRVVNQATREVADLNSAQSYTYVWPEGQDHLVVVHISAADPALLLTEVTTGADGATNQVSHVL